MVPTKMNAPLCWLSNPTAPLHIHKVPLLSNRHQGRAPLKLEAARSQTRRKPSLMPAMSSADDEDSQAKKKEDEEGEEDKGASNDGISRDWDSSWTDFNETRSSGGVFQLPTSEGSSQRDGMGAEEDKQVERLTSFWGNETGFLFAIGIIALIASFYMYVYSTGGISNNAY